MFVCVLEDSVSYMRLCLGRRERGTTHAHVGPCEERFQDILHVCVCVCAGHPRSRRCFCRVGIFLNLVGHGSY